MTHAAGSFSSSRLDLPGFAETRPAPPDHRTSPAISPEGESRRPLPPRLQCGEHLLAGCSVGVELNRPDWEEHSHSLAFTLGGRQDRHRVHVMLSAYWEALQFQLPRSPEGAYAKWHRVLDTSSHSPLSESPEVTEDWCSVQPRSIVVLLQVSNVPS